MNLYHFIFCGNIEKCLKLWYNEIRKSVNIYEIQHYSIQIK